MAKTFKDIDDEIITIVSGVTEVDVDEDIVSGKVVGYYVKVYSNRYEVEKEVYEAVKKYLEQ